MVRHNHPNIVNSGFWLPAQGDKFDRNILVKYLEFFEQDLQEAKNYRNSITKFSNVSGFAQIVKRADADIVISQKNLDLCRKLLRKLV
jgi:hypothetical protein